MESYKLSEAVDLIADVTKIHRDLTYHRFRNWVNRGWISGVLQVEGKGSGTRRTYSRIGVIEGIVMNEVAQFREGPILSWVATIVRMNLKGIERVIKDPQKRIWLMVEDDPKKYDVFKPYIVEMRRADNVTDALDAMEKSDRLIMVNLGRVLGRRKI